MRKISILILSVLAAMPLFAQGEMKDSERLVATINGERLTVERFDALWDALPPDTRKQYELTGGGKIGFLDNYIERKLLIQQAIKENFNERPEVANEIESARDTVLFNRYISDVVAAEVIPEAKLREYYESHKSDFRRPETRKARHIIATPAMQPVYNSAQDDARGEEQARSKMEGLRKQLNGDVMQFADLASKFGEDLSARSGGDLGWVRRGMLAEEMDKALFSMDAGQVSDVIQTEFGFHIVLCEAISPEGVRAFEDVKSEIAEKLAGDNRVAIVRALRALTQDLRRSSAVTIYRENL